MPADERKFGGSAQQHHRQQRAQNRRGRDGVTVQPITGVPILCRCRDLPGYVRTDRQQRRQHIGTDDKRRSGDVVRRSGHGVGGTVRLRAWIGQRAGQDPTPPQNHSGQPPKGARQRHAKRGRVDLHGQVPRHCSRAEHNRRLRFGTGHERARAGSESGQRTRLRLRRAGLAKRVPKKEGPPQRGAKGRERFAC